MPRIPDERLEEMEQAASSDEIRTALAELKRYRTAVLRWHNAERKWDFVKWEDIGEAKHEYAGRLADALGGMHKLAWEE